MTREADSPVVNGSVYRSTLLLLSSVTQMLPLESNATPIGLERPLAVVAAELLTKSVWPSTMDADSPDVRGARNSKTLLLAESKTHRLPAESKANPDGWDSLAAPIPGKVRKKSACPIRSVAGSPDTKPSPLRNSMTLLLCVSATQRFPDESNAMLPSSQKPVAFAIRLPEVKFCCPMTRLADCPIAKAWDPNTNVATTRATTTSDPAKARPAVGFP
jgi:hypothetical protein